MAMDVSEAWAKAKLSTVQKKALAAGNDKQNPIADNRGGGKVEMKGGVKRSRRKILVLLIVIQRFSNC
jgi:hypothetical protein